MDSLSMNTIAGFGKGLGDIFIGLSSEYSDILDTALLIFAACGVLITLSALFEFASLGKPSAAGGKSSGVSVMWKLFAGASLVDLAFMAKMWTNTLWLDADPLSISAYASAARSGSDHYGTDAMMAATGIIVIAGYITLGRAYFAMAKLGKTPDEQRGDVIGYIVARVLAGSAMISILHIANIFGESAGGFKLMP